MDYRQLNKRQKAARWKSFNVNQVAKAARLAVSRSSLTTCRSAPERSRAHGLWSMNTMQTIDDFSRTFPQNFVDCSAVPEPAPPTEPPLVPPATPPVPPNVPPPALPTTLAPVPAPAPAPRKKLRRDANSACDVSTLTRRIEIVCASW